jgi:transcriptional antiterminator RfaH
MSYWAIAQTEPQREHTARLMLMRAGYETYMPRYRSQRDQIKLLFPSYVFVRIAERWYPVLWTIGVQRLLMSGEQPACLPDAIVKELRQREINGFVRLPKRSQLRLRRGQQVRIVYGSLAGRIALYDGMSGRQRERVLLDLLGRKVPITVPRNAITPQQELAPQTRLRY